MVVKEYDCMKKLDARLEDAPWSHRSVQPVLVALAAVVLVALLAPYVLPPLLHAWGKPPAPVSTEPWPAAPASYSPPVLAAAVAPPRTDLPPLPEPTWQELSYLTTVEFTTATVIEEQRLAEVLMIGNLVTDRLLLKAVGEVQVGINLAEVDNVQITGKKISFVAPKPEITSVELLPDQSQIYDRQQVLFLTQYPGMETAALEKARIQLRSDIASNASMMKMAQDFARLQLTEFLQKAGFATVEIAFR
jgi:Protein of unknown function (DUF4230)